MKLNVFFMWEDTGTEWAQSDTMMAYIVETIEQAKSHGDKLEDTIKLAKQVLHLSQSRHPCDVQTGQVQPLVLFSLHPYFFLLLAFCAWLLSLPPHVSPYGEPLATWWHRNVFVGIYNKNKNNSRDNVKLRWDTLHGRSHGRWRGISTYLPLSSPKSLRFFRLAFMRSFILCTSIYPECLISFCWSLDPECVLRCSVFCSPHTSVAWWNMVMRSLKSTALQWLRKPWRVCS